MRIRVQAQPQILRRARGYAPYPVRLPFVCEQVLGCGAEDKVAFAVTRDNYAFVSQHIGDLETPEALAAFERVLRDLARLYEAAPDTATYCPSWPAGANGGSASCYYVDSTSPAATDTGNTYGYPAKPRLTIPTTLAAVDTIDGRSHGHIPEASLQLETGNLKLETA